MPFEIQQACQILGIHWNDPDLEGSAKRAYRKLAKELHPDKTGEDTSEQFNSVNNAYNAITEFTKNPMMVMHGIPIMGVPINLGAMGFQVPNGGHIRQEIDEHGNVSVTVSF